VETTQKNLTQRRKGAKKETAAHTLRNGIQKWGANYSVDCFFEFICSVPLRDTRRPFVFIPWRLCAFA
jgi:hypothetical protein